MPRTDVKIPGGLGVCSRLEILLWSTQGILHKTQWRQVLSLLGKGDRICEGCYEGTNDSSESKYFKEVIHIFMKPVDITDGSITYSDLVMSYLYQPHRKKQLCE